MNFIKAFLWLIAIVFYAFDGVSQVDSVLLKPAEITAVQYKIEPHESIENTLAKSHKIILKDYGPANISTISMRGGNAAQVQVSWNGVELNNPMLGLADLSLVNSGLFHQMNVSSSIRSFSGITGGINLQSQHQRDISKKLSVEAGVKTKSFNSTDYRVKTEYATKNYGISISAVAARALNNYSYPSGSENREFGESVVKRNGIMLSQFFNAENIGQFEFHIWVQDSFNEIPPTSVQNSSSAFQQDRFLRSQVHYHKQIKKNKLSAVASHFYDENDFTDSLNLVFAENQFSRFYGEVKLERLTDKWKQDLEISTEKIKAFSKSYADDKARIIHSGSYSLARFFNQSKLQFNAKSSLIDKELFSAYQLFADVKLVDDFFVFGGVSRTFRAPTLNDLYWRPGGNLNLIPEQALAAELGLKSLVIKEKFHSSAELTAFYRKTENWMLWAFNPELSYWSAANINQVNSLGAEAEVKLQKTLTNLSKLNLSAGGQFINSVFLETLELPRIKEGSQLYYVPRFSSNAELSFTRKQFQCSYNLGYRSQQEGVLYTIPEFTIHHASIMKTIKVKHLDFGIKVNAKNIFNTRYEMVEYRPLPGRYFELEIHIKSK